MLFRPFKNLTRFIKISLSFLFAYVIFLLWIQIFNENCKQIFLCSRNLSTQPKPSLITHSSHLKLIQEFYSNDEDSKSNSKCKIVQLNPWDPKIKDFFHKTPRYSRCQKNEPLTYIKNDVLYINQAINKTIYRGLIKKCEIAPVIRNTTINDNYELGPYVEIVDQYIELNLNYDVFKVRCFSHDSELIRTFKYVAKKKGRKKKEFSDNYKYINKSLLVYEYVHFNMRKLNDTELKYDDNKLNVMIFILDGVSLSSFKRALPNTLNYLKSFEQFFLFEKHHVTGENTFQNLMPLLSNLNYTEVIEYQRIMKNYTMNINNANNFNNTNQNASSFSKIEPPFDQVPFVWKDFKEKDYVTYFSEEWRESTFYNLKYGFFNQPTDYYLRPYWLALYDSLSYKPTILNSNAKPCYYNKLLHFLSYEWLTRFENFYSSEYNFKKNIPRFGVVKLNEMSHDYLERLFWIDDDTLELFKNLFTQKFLNNTLFIFMGDHGHRFHKIRETFIGKLEEKLPLFAMMVPKFILDKNQYLFKNLVQNTKKLTSWYDVYETLLHLLYDQKNLQNEFFESKYTKDLNENRKEMNKPRGYSLFTRLPHRNCNETFIPEYLCGCGVSLTYDINSRIIKKGAEFLVNFINNYLLKNYHDICIKLKLEKIIDAQFQNGRYSIIFKTAAPSNGIFDASYDLIKMKYANEKLGPDEVLYENLTKFKLVGRIIRINYYGTSSKCINVYWLKNFCHCSKEQS